MTASQFILVVILVASILTVINANGGGRPCTDPVREVYLNPGPNCERTCMNLGQPCGKQYIVPPRGCYCKNGYARVDDGRCIPISDCGRVIAW